MRIEGRHHSRRRPVAVGRSGGFAAALLIIAGLGLGCQPQPSYDELIKEGLNEHIAGRQFDAIAMFEKAAAFDRERPEPSYYLGRCYMALAIEQYKREDVAGGMRYCDRAIFYFDKAVGAFPGFTRAIQGKADALKLKGQNDAAIEVAKWAAKVSGPQAKKLILKGHLLARNGDWDGAQLAFQQAVSVEPDNAAAHAELGFFYLRCNNEVEAIRALRRAYALNPEAPEVERSLRQLNALPRPAGAERY